MNPILTFFIGLIAGWWGFALFLQLIGVRPEKRPAEPKQADVMDAVYDVIAASIEHEPNEWTSDGYNLANAKRRVNIWIANDDYGLGITLDGERARPNNGVLPSRLRKKLWKAVERRKAALLVERFREGATA